MGKNSTSSRPVKNTASILSSDALHTEIGMLVQAPCPEDCALSLAGKFGTAAELSLTVLQSSSFAAVQSPLSSAQQHKWLVFCVLAPGAFVSAKYYLIHPEVPNTNPRAVALPRHKL